jgi:hypothetical protein
MTRLRLVADPELAGAPAPPYVCVEPARNPGDLNGTCSQWPCGSGWVLTYGGSAPRVNLPRKNRARETGLALAPCFLRSKYRRGDSGVAPPCRPSRDITLERTDFGATAPVTRPQKTGATHPSSRLPSGGVSASAVAAVFNLNGESLGVLDEFLDRAAAFDRGAGRSVEVQGRR